MTQCATNEQKTSNNTNKLGREAYYESNYNSIREARKEELRDQGYPEFILDETDDGWDDFLKREKDFYLSEIV